MPGRNYLINLKNSRSGILKLFYKHLVMISIIFPRKKGNELLFLKNILYVLYYIVGRGIWSTIVLFHKQNSLEKLTEDSVHCKVHTHTKKFGIFVPLDVLSDRKDSQGITLWHLCSGSTLLLWLLSLVTPLFLLWFGCHTGWLPLFPSLFL